MDALNGMGLRVVLDVVYNHTFAAGPASRHSVLDKVVPGYYHRRNAEGVIEVRARLALRGGARRGLRALGRSGAMHRSIGL